jgi:Tol biopolymer transport system component
MNPRAASPILLLSLKIILGCVGLAIMASLVADLCASAAAPAEEALAVDSLVGDELIFSSSNKIFLLGEGNPTPIFLATGYDHAWSPDGDRIVFVSTEQKPWYLTLMNANGSSFVRLGGGAEPQWSLNGELIVVSARASGSIYHDIFVHRSEGQGGVRRNEVDRTNNGLGDALQPSWSPDASQIAFFVTDSRIRQWVLFVMRADGTDQKRLANGPRSELESPQWSPDGRSLLFVSDRDVAVIRSDGSGFTKLAEGLRPRWSPDGRRISFTDGRDVLMMNADGSSKVRYAATSKICSGIINCLSISAPVWSTDGRRIAYVCGNGGICVMNSDGTNNLRVSADDKASSPAWRPSSIR